MPRSAMSTCTYVYIWTTTLRTINRATFAHTCLHMGGVRPRTHTSELLSWVLPVALLTARYKADAIQTRVGTHAADGCGRLYLEARVIGDSDSLIATVASYT